MKVKVRDCTKVTVLALLMLGLIPKCIVEVILRLKVCERNSKMIIFSPCDPAEVDGGALDCVLTVGHLVIPSTPSHLHEYYLSGRDENSSDAGRQSAEN